MHRLIIPLLHSWVMLQMVVKRLVHPKVLAAIRRIIIQTLTVIAGGLMLPRQHIKATSLLLLRLMHVVAMWRRHGVRLVAGIKLLLVVAIITSYCWRLHVDDGGVELHRKQLHGLGRQQLGHMARQRLQQLPVGGLHRGSHTVVVNTHGTTLFKVTKHRCGNNHAVTEL